MKIVNKKISDLIPAEYNPRTLSTDQREQISASLKRFGFVDPVIVNTHPDRKNIIVGGHMRTRVAKEELGLTEVPCVEVELTLDQERELNIRLNKNSGEWDFEALGNYFEIDELTEWGFDPGELDLCIEDEEEPEVEEDDFDEEPPEEPKTELGRIYQLGKHRLMCGDSTSEEDVKRLMNGEKASISFTSPPYNVGSNSTLSPHVKETGLKYNNYDDDRSDYLDFLKSITEINLNYSLYYFCNIQILANNKLDLLEWISYYKENFADVLIWDKGFGQPAMAEKVCNSAFEFIYVFSDDATRAIGTKKFRGTTPNIFKLGQQSNNEYSKIHTATFPLKLPAFMCENFTNKNDIVLDVFGGTGTTLIACEQTNRQCRMMELDPKYCDVIVERYCKLKGIDPEEVFETGVAK